MYMGIAFWVILTFPPLRLNLLLNHVLTHVLFNQVVLVALLSPVLSLLPYYIQVRMMTTFGGRSWYMYVYEMPNKAGFHQNTIDVSLSKLIVTVARTRQVWMQRTNVIFSLSFGN